MDFVIDQNDTSTCLDDAAPPVDGVALLAFSLASTWEVAREVDPAGEVSILVFSTADGPLRPTFMLFERDGQAVVATIRDDVWESEHGFASYHLAVGAVLIEATRADAMPHCLDIFPPADAAGSRALER